MHYKCGRTSRPLFNFEIISSSKFINLLVQWSEAAANAPMHEINLQFLHAFLGGSSVILYLLVKVLRAVSTGSVQAMLMQNCKSVSIEL